MAEDNPTPPAEEEKPASAPGASIPDPPTPRLGIPGLSADDFKPAEAAEKPRPFDAERDLRAPEADEANFSLRELDAVTDAPPAPAPAGPPRLSVVIPCYNEKKSIRDILEAVRKVDLPKEIIVVDDFSKDGTRDVLQGELKGLYDRLVLHEKNQGKGAALRTGFHAATGDFVIVQDADLEYDPQEWKKMYPLIAEGRADVVFGSRFAPRENRPVLKFWHTFVNRMLTRLSNMFSDLNLTDMETCYKMFRRDLLNQVVLKENRFGFEPEITAKVARLGVRIYEVPITYHPRSWKQGKKIGIKDGIRAIWCILKYNLWSR
ncbi:MAG: glycosyltransferase family 2 protein [Planctomycetia bacterium]|nr:glycosyltransferase family 2 protein [Planctomycetia bacterium]